MRRLAPGSLGWLVAFNLALTWRGLVGGKRGPRRLIVFGVIGLLILLALASGLFALRGGMVGGVPTGGPVLLVAGGVGLFLTGLMLSAGVAASLESLFDRGDLDLLLQAPIRPQTVFASRALGIALSTALAVALILGPLGLLAPALLGWHFLGVWPWWLAAALTTASLSLWITLGLVRWLGVRRARTAASVVGALFGAGFFLLFQARNLLGEDQSRALTERLLEGAQAAQGSPWLATLLFPLRTLWLEALPTLLTLAASLGLFAFTVWGLTRVFVDGAQSVTAVAVKRPQHGKQASTHLRFRGGFAATLFKEWRLLWRDPLLLSRVLLQLLYLLPLVFVVGRNVGGHLLFGSGGVLLAASLAAALANLTLNAEDAPDLLRLSPLGLEGTRRAKLLAALFPVWALMAVVYAVLAARGLSAWPVYALCMLVATTGSALIYLWRPLPVRRADVFRRQQGTDLLSGLGRLTLILFVSVAAAGLPSGAWWGFVSLLLGLGVIALFWALRSVEEPRLGEA